MSQPFKERAMQNPLRVLIVEDSEDDALLLSRELRRGGYTVTFERVDTAQSFLAALESAEWDVIIADYNLPQFSGLAALGVLQNRGEDIPFLVVSGFIDENVAVAAMKSGAHDYLMKDNLKRLAPAVERELRDARVRRERRQAEEALRSSEARLRQLNDALLFLTRSTSVQEGHLDQAFREISEIAGLSLGASRAGIWLFTEDGEQLVCHQLYELEQNQFSQGQTLDIGRYPRYRTALQEHRYISTHDTRLDPRTKEFNEEYSNPLDIVSSLEATIRLHGKILGVFGLEQCHQTRRWMPEEEAFAGSVADLISLAYGAHERRLAAEALRASEQRYRDLFENANDMIYTMDLDGRITSINKRGEELTGYHRDELIGQLGDAISTPSSTLVSRKQLQRKLEGQSSHTVYELSLVTKSGERCAVEINSRLIYEDGKPVGIQGIARDIRERKQLENELRHSQKMEAIGRLAGAVAHDFNNLLTAILGYSQLLLLRLEPTSPWRREISEIERAGRSAADLTSQLLAFSRKQEVQPQILDLNHSVTNIERMLRRLIGSDVALTTRLDQRIGQIRADPGRLEQVIMNLAVNSRDAMPKGGQLHIETSAVKVDATYTQRHPDARPGEFVLLTVSDTGIGMDIETQSRIFEPFFTTKEAGKGTGLGLATVYGIVKQSGGWIEVESEQGAGATFRIFFPHVDEGAASDEAQDSPANNSGHETILLAEDNGAVRGLAREILEINGYHVLEAGEAAAAIDLCHTHSGPIAAVIADLVMPQMSGPELVRQLCLMRPNLRVLFMSGNAEAQWLPEPIEQPMDMVTKPFTPETLTRKLRAVLDRSAA
jgi:two-component system cell cycle sensor histidine kinase/response regulator CckA